jgi:hypothetical protein
MSVLRNGVPWAGLASGPAAWAASTVANYALAGTGHGSFPIVPLIAAVLVAVALAGAALSWSAWRRTPEPVATQANGIPRAFVAGIGAMGAVLFAAVIVLQGLAGVIVR